MVAVDLKVVDEFGVPYATVNSMVSMSPVTDILNTGGNFRFGLHVEDPALAAVECVEREVQVWRDGSFLAGGGWVVPVKAEHSLDGSTAVAEFDCRGLLWWFDRRFIGDADRTNYLGNGGFEEATFGVWGATGTTATLDTTRKFTGTKSAKLVQASAGTDTYLGQTVNITTGPLGALMTLAGWFYIPSAGWVGEAFGTRGLFIQYAVGGVLQDFAYAGLSEGGAIPFDRWVRRRVTIQLPPSVTAEVQVRLMSPGGTIHYDELVLVAMDSLSYYETDQALIASGLVYHLQDPTYGKSNLAIGLFTPATGVLRDQHWQHADHHPGGAALVGLTELANGFDQSIETTSTDRIYNTHYPAKGTLRSAVAWSELSAVRAVPIDGNEAASSVVALGTGDGPDREEGSALDLTRFGGRVLESVVPAQDVAIPDLDNRAQEQARLRATAARLSLTFGPGLRVGSLATGDTFNGPSGTQVGTDISGLWRAISVAWNPVTDQVSVDAEAA